MFLFTLVVFDFLDLIGSSNNSNLVQASNICHDGGCLISNTTTKSGALNTCGLKNPENNSSYNCDCGYSEDVMTGPYCGVYKDMCKNHKCNKDIDCQSSVGYYICDCGYNWYGSKCQIRIGMSKFSNRD